MIQGEPLPWDCQSEQTRISQNKQFQPPNIKDAAEMDVLPYMAYISILFHLSASSTWTHLIIIPKRFLLVRTVCHPHYPHQVPGRGPEQQVKATLLFTELPRGRNREPGNVSTCDCMMIFFKLTSIRILVLSLTKRCHTVISTPQSC